MPGIKLSDDQEKVVQELEALLAKLKNWEDYDRKDVARWHDELAKKAHDLHIELKAAGAEPKHHRRMIANRGMPPTEMEFYRHIHPVEDLLAFLHDTHANDEKQDQTIGADFRFRVFSRRWGRDDTYKMRRTAGGWWIGHLAISGDCNRKGQPYLFENFAQDGINYPADLPNYVEWLWTQAAEKGLNKSDVQRELERLGRWVSICEQNTPGGVFEEYSGPAVIPETV